MSCFSMSTGPDIQEFQPGNSIRIFYSPNRLEDLASEAWGKYVASFLTMRMEDVKQSVEDELQKAEELEQDCRRIRAHLEDTLPPIIANNVVPRMAKHLDAAILTSKYIYLDERHQSYYLRSMLPRSLRKFECFQDRCHPSVNNIFLYFMVYTIDRAFQNLKNLRVLKILHRRRISNWKQDGTDLESLEIIAGIEGDETWSALSKSCKELRSLECDSAKDYIIDSFLKFTRLESLHLTNSLLSEQSLTKLLTGFSEMKQTDSDSDLTTSMKFKSLGLGEINSEHLILIVQHFQNLTSFHVDSLIDCTLTPLQGLKHLNTLFLKVDFKLSRELLTIIGRQILTLDVSCIYIDDLVFINEYCKSVKCLHFNISVDVTLDILRSRDVNKYFSKFNLPGFDSVRCVNIRYIGDKKLRKYLLPHFVNARDVYMSVHSDTLESCIEQCRELRYIEKLFWEFRPLQNWEVIFSGKEIQVTDVDFFTGTRRTRFGQFTD